MEKESQKGGVSNLIKRIKLKYPNLTLDECIEYIESAKESIGGSFSGIEMKDIELLVKLEMKQDEKKRKRRKYWTKKLVHSVSKNYLTSGNAKDIWKKLM